MGSEGHVNGAMGNGWEERHVNGVMGNGWEERGMLMG